ncbi:MAG TPA: 30S ribosomal protein S20 [Candidatus Omnitrophota bacterium]|jgi:small subunit ribosomal protein S20|nr:30S ribosomal protein S20 [Candidatus Omnitrophota bacterium]HPW64674.1 30S ribosomal protein S20 [Candidatus Omnitrophota bacterium]HQB94473.1 30S ribosomal protein S20 [Candidatus Omnitrophota bacterium]
MPNIASAAKRMRSDAKKRARNQAVLSELKTLSKKLSQLASNPEKAKTTAAELVTRYDRAVSKGVIPRGRADRRKSRIAAFLSKLSKKQ